MTPTARRRFSTTVAAQELPDELSVHFEGRSWTLPDAFQEVRRIGQLQPLSEAERARGQQLIQHLHLVLERVDSVTGSLHLEFLDLSEQYRRLFTQNVEKSIKSSLEKAGGYRKNAVRIQQAIDLLIKRGFATNWQLTQLLPSLFGYQPSRGVYNALSSRNTDGMSFREVINIAERARWKRLQDDYNRVQREQTAGRSAELREPPEMAMQDIEKSAKGTSKQAATVLNHLPDDRTQRNIRAYYPQVAGQDWSLVEGYLIRKPSSMNEAKLLKDEILQCRDYKPPPPPPPKPQPDPNLSKTSTFGGKPVPGKGGQFSPLFVPVKDNKGKDDNGKGKSTDNDSGAGQKRRATIVDEKVKKQRGNIGPRSEAEENHHKALQVTLNYGMNMLADKKIPPISIPALQEALRTGFTSNPIPLANPTPLQERIWRWTLRQVELALNGELQATSENQYLLQDINNQNRYNEVVQLLSAMKTSGQNLGLQILQLQSFVNGMVFQMDTTLETHTGVDYLNQLIDYFTEVVRDRRARNPLAGRAFTIGDDYFDPNPNEGSWAPLQVDLRTFDDLTVTNVTVDPDPLIATNPQERLPGWFTDSTLYTLLRFMLPNARDTQRTFVLPPTVWLPIQEAAESDASEAERRAQANSWIDTAAVAPPRDINGTFAWRGNIVVPINNHGSHWTIAYIRHNPQDPSRPQVFIMDSLQSTRTRAETRWALERWFEHPALREYWGPNFTPQWMALESNRQANMWDCGLFALENAQHLDRGNNNAPIVEAPARRTAIGALLLEAINNLGSQLPPRTPSLQQPERRILQSPREVAEVKAQTATTHQRSRSGSVLVLDRLPTTFQRLQLGEQADQAPNQPRTFQKPMSNFNRKVQPSQSSPSATITVSDSPKDRLSPESSFQPRSYPDLGKIVTSPTISEMMASITPPPPEMDLDVSPITSPTLRGRRRVTGLGSPLSREVMSGPIRVSTTPQGPQTGPRPGSTGSTPQGPQTGPRSGATPQGQGQSQGQTQSQNQGDQSERRMTRAERRRQSGAGGGGGA